MPTRGRAGGPPAAGWRGLLVLALLAVAGAVEATTVVPVEDEDLVADSTAIVVGRVGAMESRWEPATRRLATDIRVTLDQVLKGDLPATEITIQQPGGQVGTLTGWVLGSPEFEPGEKVLLFLSQDRDGVLRVAHLFQGKFALLRDGETGDEFAVRDERPAGVDLLVPDDDRRPRGRVRVMERTAFERSLRALAARTAHRRHPVPRPAPPATVGALTESQGGFTFLGTPSRWFEPDAGAAVPVRLNSAGLPGAPFQGFEQVRAAYRAWSTVPESSFAYRDAGFTSAGGFARDGVNSVAFNDPRGQIDPPSRCSGTLAIGGYFSTTERRTVNGQVFNRIVEADVVFADGWSGCGIMEDYARVAQIATHELGHALGLGHSSNPDATMYAVARFDGRGAALHDDDRAGLRASYPGTAPPPPPPPATVGLTVVRTGTGSGTVTASPAGIVCGADCSEAYPSGTPVSLSASAASGSKFTGWTGGGCAGTGSTCELTVTTATTVTATFSRPLAAAILQPAGGTVVRGTVAVAVSASGGSGTGYTYTLSVGTRPPFYSGPSPTVQWDTTAVKNGSRTLKAVVRDSTGASVTVKVPVQVAN